MSTNEKLVPISGAEFSALFSNFKKTAFRFEFLQSFDVEDEKDAFRAFVSGDMQHAFPSKLPEWKSAISAATGAGKMFQRVRWITMPATDYVRWEALLGYPSLSESGEDIRILDTASVENLVTAPCPLQDFWLFDDTICILLDYDSEGRLVGFRRVPEGAIAAYVSAKSILCMKSVGFRSSSAWQKMAKEAGVTL
jgi:hypothetical protein